MAPPFPSGTSETTPAFVNVGVNRAGLSAGVYTATITINPTGGAVVTIPVTLTVTTVPALLASPTTLSFTYQPGGTVPYQQSLNVTEQSGLAVGFTATAVASPSGWLSVAPSASTTPYSLLVSVSPTSLAPGTYSGNIALATGISGSTPLMVPVTLTVTNPPLIATPAALNFTFPAFGPAPASQSFQVTAAGNAAVAFTVVEAYGLTSLAPASGTTPARIVVSVNPSVLAESPGVSGTQIVIVPAIQANPQTTIPVTFTVTAGPTVTATPASLNFADTAGGSPPPSASIQVSASGNGVVPIAAVLSTSSTWLSVTPGDSNTPSTVVTTITPVGLAPGVYTDQVLIYERVNGTQPPPVATIPVTLIVAASPTISASPTALSFAWQRGTNAPASQNFQASAPGNAVVPFTATASSNGNWLSVVPSSGSTPAALTVSVSPAPLAPGAYTGTITLNGTVTIAISLTVTASPLQPAIASLVNAASYSSGAVSPGEIVTLTGTALGPAVGLGTTLDSNGNVATSVGGVSVSFDGYLAPLVYVSQAQINCVVPYEIVPLTYPVVQVSYAGQTSSPYSLSVVAAAPGIFTATASGTGQAAILNGSGGVNGPNNPAAPSSTIVIYLTGEGQTLPAGVTGKVTTVSTSPTGPLTPQPVLPPLVTIGGQPATVSFYGEAPGLVSGALQINAQVPAGLPSGNLPLIVSFGGINSQNGVTVAVQ